jgi:trk system potassium uptake protein TrkA
MVGLVVSGDMDRKEVERPMRVACVGAGEITVKTAEILIDRGHQVVIIEDDKARIDDLSDLLDCSFLQGDGSSPAILKEVDPKGTDVLFCLTDKDQHNIIASLVGRSLGFQRIITQISNPEYEGICVELGLTDTIVPSRTISRFLADMVQGLDILELSTVMRGEARFFVFSARAEDAGPVSELDLPGRAKVICFYRDNEFVLADEGVELTGGEDVVILTHSENLPTLRERCKPEQSEAGDQERSDQAIR